MKKILFAFIFFFLAFNANSQWYQKYGVSNINDLSKKELEFSLAKTKTNLKTGKILTLSGIGIGSIGIMMGAHATIGIFNTEIDKTFNEYSAATMLMLGGIGAMAIGIPFWVINANRRNQIEIALIKLKYSSNLGNYQPETLSFHQPIVLGLNFKVSF